MLIKGKRLHSNLVHTVLENHMCTEMQVWYCIAILEYCLISVAVLNTLKYEKHQGLDQILILQYIILFSHDTIINTLVRNITIFIKT